MADRAAARQGRQASPSACRGEQFKGVPDVRGSLSHIYFKKVSLKINAPTPGTWGGASESVGRGRCYILETSAASSWRHRAIIHQPSWGERYRVVERT